MPQPRVPVRSHHDQVAPEPIQDPEDVTGVGPVGHDHLMSHPDPGVAGRSAMKPVPQVCRPLVGRSGEEWAALHYHGGRAGDVEEDHLGAGRTGQRGGQAERLVGMR